MNNIVLFLAIDIVFGIFIGVAITAMYFIWKGKKMGCFDLVGMKDIAVVVGGFVMAMFVLWLILR